MNKYLVACDLDNTLLTEDKIITKKSIKYIKKYVKKGNYFVICTGRPLSSAIKFWKMIGIDMPIITDNGATITYPKHNEAIEFPIKLETFKEFLGKTNDCISTALSSSKNKLFMQNRKEIPEWIIHFLPETEIIEGNLYEIIDVAPTLPNIWVTEEGFEKFNKVLKEYEDEIEYRYWGFHEGKHSYELFAKNTSKGSAMKYLAQKLGCNVTISFGDQLNDLSMIEMADYGVVMINGIDELKKKTKYITTKDFNHNGVIHYLKKNKLY